jgi:hypothetical protein
MPAAIPSTNIDKLKIECAGVPAGAKMLVGESKKHARIWVEDMSQKSFTNHLSDH